MDDRLGRFLARRRIAVVLPHVRGRLLDVGCGENELVRRYGDGVGVDVYPWDGVDLVVADAAVLPFPDESFDTVTILAALNHIPNRQEVLNETARVLKPDGQLVLTMIPPGISKVWHRLRRRWDVDQRDRGMKPGEVYGLTMLDIRRLLVYAGYETKKRKRFLLINRLVVAKLRRRHASTRISPPRDQTGTDVVDSVVPTRAD